MSQDAESVKHTIEEFQENNNVEVNKGAMSADGETTEKIIVISPIDGEDIILTMDVIEALKEMLEMEDEE